MERYVMRWGVLEGLSWYGIHGLHGLSCPVMLHGMARMEYMSGACHVMACMEYMSGACHVRAWHGMYGKHVGGLSCHGMTWNTCQGLVMLGHCMARMEYMSGIAMSWHAWNTCRGLPCHHASMLPCHVQWFKSWAVQPNTSAELWPD